MDPPRERPRPNVRAPSSGEAEADVTKTAKLAIEAAVMRVEKGIPAAEGRRVGRRVKEKGGGNASVV